MASIKQRADGRWRARYRDDAGREHARHFPRKVDAQNWLNQVTAAVVTGRYVDPKAGKITFAEYAERWEHLQVGRAATKAIIDNAIRLHLVPALGPRAMMAVLPSHLQAIVRGMEASHSPGTIAHVYGVASRIFAAAVNDRVIAVSPCRDVRLPKPPGGEITPPTIDEVLAMANAMPDHLGAAVIMLAGSGLRIGELLGLEVRHVDFLRQTVKVEQQRLQTGEIAPPKTESSIRTVPIADFVKDALAVHLSAYPSKDYLFRTRAGAPVVYSSWIKAWILARKKAGLTLGTHDLRHFFASALIAGGASVKLVQTALGHHSAAVTLTVYSHLWPGDEDRTRSIMDATFRGLGADSVATAPGQTT